MLIIKAGKLNKHTGDGHKVVIINDVEVVDDGIPDIDKDITQRLSIVTITCLRALESFEYLFVGVLVLTDDQSHVRSSVFDLLGEVLREHVVDLDNKSKSNKTLNDHTKLLSLTNGDLQNNLGEDR